MITDRFQLRPRYNEVDQMGYVYHANYVAYCHQARTELLRKYDLNDHFLEENNVMLPVVSFSIEYIKPTYYDELLTIKTTIKEKPSLLFKFDFEIRNSKNELTTRANSTVVFARKDKRDPIRIPDFVEAKLEEAFQIAEARSSIY